MRIEGFECSYEEVKEVLTLSGQAYREEEMLELIKKVKEKDADPIALAQEFLREHGKRKKELLEKRQGG
jgi:hypothetical protein